MWYNQFRAHDSVHGTGAPQPPAAATLRRILRPQDERAFVAGSPDREEDLLPRVPPFVPGTATGRAAPRPREAGTLSRSGPGDAAGSRPDRTGGHPRRD